MSGIGSGNGIAEEKAGLRKRLAPLMIIAAGCLWGCMGILVRTLNQAGLGTMEIVAVRCLVTFLCMLIGMGLLQRDAIRVKLQDIWCFFGTGILSIVFFNYCYFKTITMTSLSVAAILLYTAPALVMAMSAMFFGERMSVRKLAALGLTFAGCVCVTGGFDSRTLSAGGVLTGLGAGLGYALYSIFSRFAIDRGYQSLTITLWTFGIGAVGCVPLTDTARIAASFRSDPSVILSAGFWIFMTTVLAYILYTMGLQYMETGRASVISSIEPVVASVLGVAFYRETISWYGIAGIVLVISAIIMINQKDHD